MWLGLQHHKLLTRSGCACAGEHGLFVDTTGVPVFLAPLEAYMTGVRVKLVQWSDRLLAEACALHLHQALVTNRCRLPGQRPAAALCTTTHTAFAVIGSKPCPLQEAWAPVGGAGTRCSRALVEIFTALAAVAEGNARVAAAGATYAALLERALVKVAMHHTASLERLCQARIVGTLSGV